MVKWKYLSMCLALVSVGCTAEMDVSAGEGALSSCIGNDCIEDPPLFQWTSANGYEYGTLEMVERSFTLNNGETIITRVYGQPGGHYGVPGPTIKMEPGKKYVLKFHNRLPFEPATGEHNVLKDPNVSNIHTHGLHISGESPGDDVSRSFEGGFGGDFVYDIPSNHSGGTYWYHAHHHGSTFLQVSAGAFGLIVIDDSNDGMPAAVEAMPERNLVIAYLDPGVAGTGGDTLISGTVSPTWTVNGMIGGRMEIPSNTWHHFRVLLADRDATEKTVAFPSGCTVDLMARDGVWRSTGPKRLSTNSISLTGASRADFAIKCDAGTGSIRVGNGSVADLVVTNSGVNDPGDYSVAEGWNTNRPAYLRDLRNTPSNQLNPESVRMGARTVNGSKFDHQVPTFELPADKVQDWSVSGAARHPFHLHVYHMQAQNCGSDYEPGEYYDVIASNCNVRFDMNAATSSPYAGRTIMHCHILEHEDQGAMGWMNVLGGTPAPSFPSGASFDEGPYALEGGMCTVENCTDGSDNDCDGAVDCDDSDCSSDAACATGPECGDGTCDAGEDSCSCASDCGVAPSSENQCGDGSDNDCDGAVDCNDSDCNAAAECSSTPVCGDGICNGDEDCNTCNDCQGQSRGPASRRYCCGDGTAQSAEGDGTICDGNY